MDGELQVCALHLIGTLLGDVKKPSVTASFTGLEILELTLFLTKFKLTLVGTGLLVLKFQAHDKL